MGMIASSDGDFHEALKQQSPSRDRIQLGIENQRLVEGKEFRSFLIESIGGRPSKEDIFTRGAVDARELHKELHVAGHYRNWIHRGIENQGLVEGQDFRPFLGETSLVGGRPSQEYMLTLRAAKKLAMTVNSERGYQVRRYFPEVKNDTRRAGRAHAWGKVEVRSQGSDQ